MTNMPPVPSFGVYFARLARVTVPVYGLGLGLLLALSGFVYAGIPGAVAGFVLGALGGVLQAAFVALLSSARRPMASPQEARPPASWRWVDVGAPCDVVAGAAAEALRNLTRSEAQVGQSGPQVRVLRADTAPNLFNWGNELLVWVECQAPDRARVQVVARPVMATAIVGAGRTRSDAAALVDALKARFAVAAEG